MNDTENPKPPRRGGKQPQSEGGPGAARKRRGSKPGHASAPKAPFLTLPRPPAGEFEKAAATGGCVSDLSPGLMVEFMEIRVQRALSIPGTCRILGIHDDTYRGWRRKGEADIAAGNQTSLYAQFVTLVPRSREELLGTLQYLLLRLATGQAGEDEGNFGQISHLLAILFPERNLEVARFVTEQNAALLNAAKVALERFPGAYERLVSALAEGA